MRKEWILIFVVFIAIGCSNPLDKKGPDVFTLKFINCGHYSINAFYLQPVEDTANWGPSILPVAALDSIEYVLFDSIKTGPTYAFKAKFDSAGTVFYMKYGTLYTSASVDTITCFAALADNGWSTGHNWGMAHYPGEINVTP
jgi:hypothetical protein